MALVNAEADIKSDERSVGIECTFMRSQWSPKAERRWNCVNGFFNRLCQNSGSHEDFGHASLRKYPLGKKGSKVISQGGGNLLNVVVPRNYLLPKHAGNV